MLWKVEFAKEQNEEDDGEMMCQRVGRSILRNCMMWIQNNKLPMMVIERVIMLGES